MNYRIPIDELKAMPKPAHIAIIMDGNGRWAKRQGYPRTYGHLKGVGVVERITEFCAEIGVCYLTLYSFSTENWKRPPAEVSYLMSIFYKFMKSKLRKFMNNNIRFNVMGRVAELPENVREMIAFTKKETARNTGMVLNLAVNYSGRAEIADAVKKLLIDYQKNGLAHHNGGAPAKALEMSDLGFIDNDFLKKYLYEPGIPDPELMIRTSNEFRISNFLLWQLAYSEIFITEKFWPEITPDDLIDAILSFNKRERRFGGVEAAAPRK